ncbi:MAG: hypothetical protein EA367_15915 [Leptolyngbya sp. DLM2.Bin15]|nr:MAG: hypothetical protein EA367_15915 [Leptolyngbya sp. DLM2.Bin15]
MNTCPCCSEPLLRHARRGGVYWFCPHCRQEMPNLASVVMGYHHSVEIMSVSTSLPLPTELVEAC